jgi:hypothetical protein
MLDNPNTEYEKLTQDIYQTLNANESFKNIKVQHNVKIKGKSGCEHQIDVYWEFTNMGEIHKVAIECKNYNKEVSIGKIRDFFGVLHDIGNVKGIFVTKIGYQKGAKLFGDYYDISLKELRFPIESDWNNRVKDIIVDIIPYTKQVTNREFHFNSLWLKNNMTENFNVNINALSDEVKIIDINDKPISTLYDLENELPVDFSGGAKQGITKKYEFENSFILFPQYPKIMIDAITFTYDILTDNVRTIIEGEEIAKAILKDVKSGNITFFDKEGNVR